MENMKTMNKLNDNKFLGIKEAAERLGVKPSRLRSWDKTGKFKAHRHPINNYRMYSINNINILKQRFELDFLETALEKKIPHRPEFETNAQCSSHKDYKRTINVNIEPGETTKYRIEDFDVTKNSSIVFRGRFNNEELIIEKVIPNDNLIDFTIKNVGEKKVIGCFVIEYTIV